MTKPTTLLYIATDGSYGDATDLLLVDASEFTNDDYEALDAVDDAYRQEEAAEIAVYRSDDRLRWVWMTENEALQIIDTLNAAINAATALSKIGLAAEIGDARDVLLRSGIHAD